MSFKDIMSPNIDNILDANKSSKFVLFEQKDGCDKTFIFTSQCDLVSENEQNLTKEQIENMSNLSKQFASVFKECLYIRFYGKFYNNDLNFYVEDIAIEFENKVNWLRWNNLKYITEKYSIFHALELKVGHWSNILEYIRKANNGNNYIIRDIESLCGKYMYEVRYQWNVPKVNNYEDIVEHGNHDNHDNHGHDTDNHVHDTDNHIISVSNEQRIDKLQQEKIDLLESIEYLKRRTLLLEERQQKLASNGIIP